MNYTAITIFILIVTTSTIYLSVKRKKTNKFFKLLESEYPNYIKTNGKVKFSSIHILLDIDLQILYSENDLLIYGYDYYRHRNTKFIFHTNKDLKSLQGNNIPNYLISKISIIENKEIVITNEDDGEITIMYKSYRKEKLQLKEEKFTELLNNLNKNYLQHHK